MIIVFWDVTSYIVAAGYNYFGGSSHKNICIKLQLKNNTLKTFKPK
jgi:hypothetical protein